MKLAKSQGFKIALVSICIFGFSFNSLATIKAYLEKSKVSTQLYELKYDNFNKLSFPSVTFCEDTGRHSVAFENDIYTLEQYDDYSWLRHDHFFDVYVPPSLVERNISRREAFIVEKLYTRYYGKCFAFTFKENVILTSKSMCYMSYM